MGACCGKSMRHLYFAAQQCIIGWMIRQVVIVGPGVGRGRAFVREWCGFGCGAGCLCQARRVCSTGTALQGGRNPSGQAGRPHTSRHPCTATPALPLQTHATCKPPPGLPAPLFMRPSPPPPGLPAPAWAVKGARLGDVVDLAAHRKQQLAVGVAAIILGQLVQRDVPNLLAGRQWRARCGACRRRP